MSLVVSVFENGEEKTVFITDSQDSAMAVAMAIVGIPGTQSCVRENGNLLAAFNSPIATQKVVVS
jgi:hypothetical protein